MDVRARLEAKIKQLETDSVVGPKCSNCKCDECRGRRGFVEQHQLQLTCFRVVLAAFDEPAEGAPEPPAAP